MKLISFLSIGAFCVAFFSCKGGAANSGTAPAASESGEHTTSPVTTTGEQQQDLKNLKNLSYTDFQKIVSAREEVLVDFNATWCGPCKMLKPAIEEIEKENEGKVTVLSIDTDLNPDLANALHIAGIPHLEIYKKGKLAWKNEGLVPKSVITKEL